MVKAVILDWAGTTIDFGSFAPIQAFIAGFKSVGLTITPEMARKHMGLLKMEQTRAIAAMLPDPLSDEDIRRVYASFEHSLFESLADHCDVKPRVIETVAELRKRGIRIGSTTGYTAEMMREVTALAANAGYEPDFVVAANEVPRGRPYPYMMWRNLIALGVDDAREAVKAGDTVADIREGRSVGCWSVGIVTGSSELGLSEEEIRKMDARDLAGRKAAVRSRFYAAGADYILDDIDELPAAIDDINRKLSLNAPRKLLTPGPLTTRASVKLAAQTDHCTWDEEYKEICRSVTRDITAIAADEGEYATVLLQGSGSYAVEAMVVNFCPPEERALVLVNGEYGRRVMTIAAKAGLAAEALTADDTAPVAAAALEARLSTGPRVDAVIIVHCETTTGVLNPLDELARVAKARGCRVLVDAMSSFAAYPIDMNSLDIDALASSSNKALEGLPGLSFVVAKRSLIEESKGRSRSHCLDLHDQYLGLYRDGGKFRFTSPTTILLALRQALDDYRLEGGLAARSRRYVENRRALTDGLAEIGLRVLVAPEYQSYIITTVLLGDLDFNDLYATLKRRGFVIYPGKLTAIPTFRVGTIGDVHPADMEELVSVLGEYVRRRENRRTTVPA